VEGDLRPCYWLLLLLLLLLELLLLLRAGLRRAVRFRLLCGSYIQEWLVRVWCVDGMIMNRLIILSYIDCLRHIRRARCPHYVGQRGKHQLKIGTSRVCAVWEGEDDDRTGSVRSP
jgi:hypothetical protein